MKRGEALVIFETSLTHAYQHNLKCRFKAFVQTIREMKCKGIVNDIRGIKAARKRKQDNMSDKLGRMRKRGGSYKKALTRGVSGISVVSAFSSIGSQI